MESISFDFKEKKIVIDVNLFNVELDAFIQKHDGLVVQIECWKEREFADPGYKFDVKIVVEESGWVFYNKKGEQRFKPFRFILGNLNLISHFLRHNDNFMEENPHLKHELHGKFFEMELSMNKLKKFQKLNAKGLHYSYLSQLMNLIYIGYSTKFGFDGRDYRITKPRPGNFNRKLVHGRDKLDAKLLRMRKASYELSRDSELILSSKRSLDAKITKLENKLK